MRQKISLKHYGEHTTFLSICIAQRPTKIDIIKKIK